jgi:ribosomal protein S18 acetylase RimI-like enzyme
MIIRPFLESDERAVTRLWDEVFPGEPVWNDARESIRRKLGHQRELFFVAELNDIIVGTAMAGFDGYRGWVYYVAVAPEQRNKGIGAQLMENVEKALAGIGCPQVNLLLRHTSIEVASFYRHLGYSVEPKICMG